MRNAIHQTINTQLLKLISLRLIVVSLHSRLSDIVVIMLTLKIFPFLWVALFAVYYNVLSYSFVVSIVLSFSMAYLPTYIESSHVVSRDGSAWPWFQQLKMWNFIRSYFKATVTLEEELNHKKQYIFCCFPHGPISVNHLLTMTNGCEMLTTHYKGVRRDLCASILFTIPIFKDILIWLGCVDASPYTAHYNLKKGNSIFIYVGGEKEQLMSESGFHRIYLKERKGFVKLALQYGADLIPMYAFGENEVYTTSNAFMSLRKWLQKNLSLGIPICYGRWGSFVPHKKRLALEVGKPIPVKAIPKDSITQQHIDELHGLFMKEMQRLFDRTKIKYAEHAEKTLEIY